MSGVFYLRNRKHVLRVSIDRNTRESLGELEKAVETLACGSCSHSISRSPKLSNFPSLFSQCIFIVKLLRILDVEEPQVTRVSR